MNREPARCAAPDGAAASRLITDRRLLPLAERAGAGGRLGFDDGMLLYETADLTGVAAMAHLARTRLHGGRAFFVRSRRASYTNVCAAGCRFCAFHADPGAPGGYTLPPAEFAAEMEKLCGGGVTELHIVGGHNPELKVEYFEGLLRAVKARLPALHVKAFTMVEIDFYAKNSSIPAGEFLDRCVAAGLGSCPGGGAEIFDAEVRAAVCPGKGDAGVWLETAMACHERGLPTNCTMLYGHVEGPRHRVDHLLRLRGAQDLALERGLAGFSAYVPLAYQPGGNPLGRSLGIPRTTGARDLRELAVGRLLLDNVPHVKAHWHMVTPGLAQVGLSYGADDLDGTAEGEEIAHRAGAEAPPGLGAGSLRRLISEAGFDAEERIPLHSGGAGLA
jgi:aminodeoxyfutalosine synthase